MAIDPRISALADEGRKRLNDNIKEKERLAYARGQHDLPWGMPEAMAWYSALQGQSTTPLIRRAVREHVQRLRVDDIRLDSTQPDVEGWRLWNRNYLTTRQAAVYEHSLIFERGGVVGVWWNPSDPSTPFIRPEDPLNVYVSRNALMPFDPDWAFKAFKTNEWDESLNAFREVTHEYLYTRETIWHWTDWTGEMLLVEEFANTLKRVPFVVFKAQMDASGEGQSFIDPLISIQSNLDKLLFDMLVAAQFSAFRQVIATGFDPRVRDADGEVVYYTNPDGSPVIIDGEPVPMLNDFEFGPDRILSFASTDTKITELSEATLTNYTSAREHLTQQFAAVAQLPQHIFSGEMTNVSGASRTADESSSRSFSTALQNSFVDAWAAVFELVNLVRGSDSDPVGTRVHWAPAVPMTVAEVGQAVSMMVPHGFPIEALMEWIPGATPSDVRRWMGMSQSAVTRAMSNDFAGLLTGVKPDAETTDLLE